MDTKRKIFVVVDEVELAETYRDYLVAESYEAIIMHSADGLVESIRSTPPDLALLDLTQPEKDSLAVCREVRQFSDLPIIIVSEKGEAIDCIRGLDIGADDYICKPVKPHVVVARVKAVLRRSQTDNNPRNAIPLELNKAHYDARWDGEDLKLTPVEFRLLKLLAHDPGRVFTRNQIKNAIYEDDRYVSGRSIDSHVKNVRRKLAIASKIENPIRAVHGVGYKLDIESISRQ